MCHQYEGPRWVSVRERLREVGCVAEVDAADIVHAGEVERAEFHPLVAQRPDPQAVHRGDPGVVEPGGVATELGSHNKPEVRNEMIDPFYEQTEVLAPEDIADGVAYMVTRPCHTAISELWIMPTDQA